MAFPHRIVNRVAWVVTAVAAVLLIARELREPNDGVMEQSVLVGSGVARADSIDWSAAVPPRSERARSGGRRVNPRSRVGRASERPIDAKDVILALTGVGDDEALVQGFAVTRPLDIRVYALGEGIGGEMYDYGAIVDATTRRTVWRMHYGGTFHAGGADKNRVSDEVIALEPGNYLVYYVTDDSHSYLDWNSDAPADEASWGITVLSADGPVDKSAVGPYDDGENPAVLARLTGVRDDEFRSQRFTLERDTEVRIYAIGEGGEDEMYDFAWIQRASTGQAVWRMRYPATEHAGGARKNRLFDGTLRLERGEYVLVYQSDDSHSFGDWNSDAPDDEFNYGVTVFRQ